MAPRCWLWTKRIAFLRIWLCLLTLAAAEVACADYVFATFNGVVRYNSSGERMFNYRLADPNESPGTWLAESVDGLALGPNGRTYAIGNNLGTLDLREFDSNTGIEIPRIVVEDGWEHYVPLRVSSFFPVVPPCGIACNGGFIQSARFRGGMIFHPDGYVYSLGAIDHFSFDSNGFGDYVNSEHALVRFSITDPAPPQVVTTLGGTWNCCFGESPVGLALAPDESFYFRRGINSTELLKLDPATGLVAEMVASLPVGSYGNSFGPDGLIYYRYQNHIMRFNPQTKQVLGSFIDLGPFSAANSVSYFGGWFFDSRGRLLLPMNFYQDGYFTSLLEFDGQTGEYRRTVFTDQLSELEIDISGGFYLPIPEPSSAILAALGLGIVCGVQCLRKCCMHDNPGKLQ